MKDLKGKLDDMYEKEEWNPEWVAEIGKALTPLTNEELHEEWDRFWEERHGHKEGAITISTKREATLFVRRCLKLQLRRGDE